MYLEIKECEEGYESVFPTHAKVDAIVIMLHGYGSTADDIVSLSKFLCNSTSSYYFFAPNGINKAKDNWGWQWFDIQKSANTQVEIDALKRGIITSTNRIVKVLQKKIDYIKQNYNMSDDFKIYMTGFSQGAMVSLHLSCFNYIENVQKVIAFSGAFVDVTMEQEYYDKNLNLHIALLHGTEDSIIPVQYMDLARERLQQIGFKNIFSKSFKNLSHSINHECLEQAKEFLQK